MKRIVIKPKIRVINKPKSRYKLNEKREANIGCFPCPFCGERRFPEDMPTSGKKRGLLREQRIYHPIFRFGRKTMAKDHYTCYTCGAVYESKFYSYKEYREEI